MTKKPTALAEPQNLEAQLTAETTKRALLAEYIKTNMKAGVDFYTLKIGGRDSKPSLSKPGSEKFMSLFQLRAEFTKDTDTWDMLGSVPGMLCYLCRLYSKKGEVVGEGRGARDSKKDGNDPNKAIKMAEKSAQIDAILRTGALSDFFTQDVEDMQGGNEAQDGVFVASGKRSKVKNDW